MSKEKDRQPFISVRDLKKYFCLDNYKLAKAKTRYIHAVDDVSFDIYKGEIFGIIGESGSGKSTIGRCVLKLIDVDSGEIYFDGKNITHVSRKEQQELRSRMQMVFQNPLASFDPKKTIRFSLEESAKVHKIKPEVYKARIKQLMEYIALPEDLLTRYPKDLSGGQLQRLAIARALMLEPDFILADEPVSALDVSVQAQILNLMLDLKEDKGQTILFISHDLNVVRHVCDRIAVVYLGAVMEMGTVEQIYNSVAHPYTQALISAKPKEHPLENKKHILLEGDIPNAVDIPEGCRFAGRCRYFKEGLCDNSGGNSETVLRVGYTQEPSSFDPADFTIVAATLTGYDCYDTLLNFSHDGTTVEPALAESWEQVDDTTYTYKIRQGVKFSDGNEMTMDDVLYSLNRVTEDNYYMSYLFANVDSFEANNDTWTLTVHLKQPDSSWQYVPATSACTIVEKSVTEEQGDKYGTADGKTVGTGPYKLSSWSSGSEIVLEKNENWWGDPDTLDIDKVEYYVIEDESALALAAKGGQIDFVEGMSNSVMSVYQSCQNFNILSCEGTTSNYIAFNTASKPFDDEWARKAVAYCIDRSQITTTIGGDYAKQSAVVPMSESMMYMDKDKWDSTIAESDVYTQDYDKVKECLAKSKYPDGFEFDFYTTSQTQKQAELLKSMVDASGSITMNLVEVPDSDIFSYMFGYKTKDNGERYYNAVGTYMMSDFLDPMGMLKTLYAGSNACEGGTNETLWTSTEADGLLDKAAQTTDDAEKMGYYTDAYKIFADECPYLGLYTSSDVYAVSDKFTYDPSPMFWYNFSYADVHVAK